MLRTQVERSAAALEAGGDASETSRTLKRHAAAVRRLHDHTRAYITRERSTERKLRNKVRTYVCVFAMLTTISSVRENVCNYSEQEIPK